MKYIWNENFLTMNPSLGRLYKIQFSDLSQCYFPKWQASLSKTTLLCKTKVSYREVPTAALKNICLGI